MTSRTILAVAAAAIVLAACGGSDSDGADTTPPEITLLTTTTEPPLLEEVDGDESIATETTEDATTTIAPDATTTAAPDTAATSVAATTTPAEPAPASIGGDFVLGADGLGAVPFGADPDQTVTFVSSVIGAPTSDTGWVDPFEIGPCGGTRLRQVAWNSLLLEFSDVSDVVQGRDHFYAYFYGSEGSSTPQPAGFRTAEQIGAGSTVSALLAAYPEVTLLEGDEFIGPSFNINDNLAGRMSGLADDDVVEVVIGGRPCDG